MKKIKNNIAELEKIIAMNNKDKCPLLNNCGMLDYLKGKYSDGKIIEQIRETVCKTKYHIICKNSYNTENETN